MPKKIKTPDEWVDEGVPWPPQRETMVRWAALIQEDAVSCYTVTEAIEKVESAYWYLANRLRDGESTDQAQAKLEMEIQGLALFKMPMSEEE
ncbi:hypothetical protein EBR25_14380 [bacterium]|nr:hypothetical protein [bacterium]